MKISELYCSVYEIITINYSLYVVKFSLRGAPCVRFSPSHTYTHKNLSVQVQRKGPGYKSRQSPPQDRRNNRWPLFWRPPPPHPSVLLRPPYSSLFTSPNLHLFLIPLFLLLALASTSHPQSSSSPAVDSFSPIFSLFKPACSPL